MARVTRPGGSIAIIEPDFDTNSVNVPHRDITRRVLAQECDTAVVGGRLVRDLRSILRDAGLRDVAQTRTWSAAVDDLFGAIGYYLFTATAS